MRPKTVHDQPEFEDIIQAFEQAVARGPADVRTFLPRPDHAQYAQVLRELIRLDIEYSWERGDPQLLRTYLRLFPELSEDRLGLQEIAFEEYRLRRQAGENVSAESYGRDYGVEVHSWPQLPEPAGSCIPAYWTDSAAASAADCRHGVRDLPPEPLTGFPQVGSSFLGFHLLAELGRGAFGRVYLAQQGDLANRLVALKVCSGGTGESQTLAQLQHTNIVPIYSTHRAGALHAVCMPYFGAATLADVIAQVQSSRVPPLRGSELVRVVEQNKAAVARLLAGQLAAACPPMPAMLAVLGSLSYTEAVLSLTHRLADGLVHAHAHGILHRDLKPANILLTDEGQPMLVDFNLSADIKVRAGASSTQLGGTLPYMAPEHLRAFLGTDNLHSAVDVRSDLYALGVILFQLLAGQYPFPIHQGILPDILTAMIADRQLPVPLLRRFNRAVSPAVESIVRKLLHPTPAQRYQSANELRIDVQCQLEAQPLRYAPEPSLVERLRKWVRRHPRLTSPLTLATLLLIALSSWLAFNFFSNWRRTVVVLSGVEKNFQAEQIKHLDARKSLKGTEALLDAVKQTLDEEERQKRLALADVAALQLQAHESINEFREVVALSRQIDDDVGKVHLADQGPAQLHDYEPMITRCRAALQRHAVLDDLNWHQAPRFCLLPDAERAQLRSDVGELIYLLNRATLLDVFEADARRRPFEPVFALTANSPGFTISGVSRSVSDWRLAEALRCNGIACECYPPEKTPRFLVMQRAVLAGLLGDATEAATLQRRAEGIIPQTARDYYLTAYECAARSRFGDALAFARRACRQDPRQASAWFLFGFCQAKTGDAAEAIRSFDFALALNPRWSMAWYHRGLTHGQLGHWQEAAADFASAAENEPQLAMAYVQRANALEALRQDEEALGQLNRALSWRPDLTEARLRRGLLLARFMSRTAAHADAVRCLADESSPTTTFRVACIYAQTARQHAQDRDQALRLIAKALQDGYDAATAATDERLAPLHEDPGFRQLFP